MATDLKKQFFDTFGIEKRTTIIPRYSLNSEYYEEIIEEYPQITDRILLELICIYNVFVRMVFYSSYVKDLKIEVLETLIKEYKNRKQTGAFDENLKEKVQALFKEER